MRDAADAAPQGPDPRWDEVARLVVEWSTGVERGDRVLLALVEPEAYDLARLIHARVVRAGGHPMVVLGSESFEADILRDGSEALLAEVPALEARAVELADVVISLRAGGAAGGDVEGEPRRIAARRRAHGLVSAARTGGTRWVIVRLPTAGVARQAGVPLDTLTEWFFGATLRDWSREGDALRRLAGLFDRGDRVRVTGRGTDLSLSITGRTWLIDDGHINLPGGEVATSPVEDSAEGEVLFEGPMSFAGHELRGIRCRFERGLAVEARADRNDALLQELLAIDDGARRVGELGFGANPGLASPTGEFLYDEKVPGTFHLALGRSYAQCGGRNASALHWDLVKDLRAEGTVAVDGRIVLDRGQPVGT